MRRQQSAGNVDSSICVCRCNACNFAASSVRQLELHAASAANSSVSSSHARGVRILVALRHVLSTISRKIALHSGSHRESAVNTYCASSSSSPSTSLVTSSTFHCATSLDFGGASNLLISQQYRHPTITDYSSANPVSDNAPPPPALFNGDSEKKNDDGNLTQIINDKTGDNNSHKVNTVGEEVCQVQGETNVLETYAVDVPVLTSSSGEDSCLAFELLAKRRCWLKCALCSAFGLYDNNSSIWFGGDLNAFLKHIRNAHITVEKIFSSQVEENGLVRRSEGHTSQGYADLHQWIRRCVVISKCQNECFSSSDTGSSDDEHEAAEICVQSRHIRGSFASEEKVTAQPELRGSVRTTIAENCDKLTYATSRLPAAGTLSSPRRPRTSSCASATQSDVASSTQADAGSDEVCVPLANNAIGRQKMDNNVGYKSKRSYRHTLSPYNHHLPYVQSQSWCSKVAVGKRAKLDNGLRNCTEIGNFSGKTDNNEDKPKIVTTIGQRSTACSPLKYQPNQKHLVSTTARSASEPTLSGSAADYGLELVMQSLETSEISKSTLPAASHENSTTPEISSPIDADTIRCSECNASLSTMWLLKAHVEECHGQNVVSSAKLAAFSTAVRQHSLNDLLAFLVPQEEETRTGSTKAKKHNLAGEYETANAGGRAMSSSEPGFRVWSSSTKNQQNEKSASSQPLSSGDASITQFTSTPVPMASLQSTSSRTTKQANAHPPLLSAPVTSSSSLLPTASSTLLSSFLTTLFALPNHFASTERILSSAMSSILNTTSVDGAGTNMASLLDHILCASSASPNIFQTGTNIREYAMAATEYQRRNLLGQMLQAAANPPASTTTSSSLLTQLLQPENATLCGFAIPSLPASSDLTAVELRAAVVAAPSSRSVKPSAPSTASSPQQQKRARTRITDEQLKVLRANFNINNSPNDEQYQNMCSSTLLPLKVVKHWFRNTLFKERQKNKDSPYNFSIPPLSSSSKLFENSDCELTRKEATWSHLLAAQQEASETPKHSWRERVESSDSFPLPDENRGANLDDTARVNYAECSAANKPQDFQISTETSAEDNASSCDSVADDERGDNVSRGRQTHKGKGIGSLLDRKRTPVSMSMFEVEIADGRDDFQAVGGEEDEEDPLVNEQDNYVLSNDDIVDLYYHGSSRRISSTSSDRGGDDGCDANIAKEATLASENSVAASCGPTADIVLCNVNDSLSAAKTNPLAPPPISDKTCPTPTTSTVFGASPLKFADQHHTVGPFGGELVSAPTNVPNNTHSTAGSSKRANRTKFSEHQLKSLQDYFDKNPYPKDNDLEHLSTELKLAPRVITVWFQNQRQKARKSYGGSEGSGAIVSSSSSPSPTTSALSTPTSSYRSPSKPVLPGTKERTPEVLTAHTNVRSSSKSPTALNSATEYQCRVCVRYFRSYFELVKHHELHGSECCTISADKNGKPENKDGSFRRSSSSSTSERKRPTTMISTTADKNNSSSSVINVPVQAEPCTKSTWQQAATDIVRKSPGAVCYGSFTHKNEEAFRAFQAPPVTVPVKVKPSRGRASTLQPLSKPALGALRVTNSFRSSDEGIAENPEETTWNTQVNSLDAVSERQAQQQFQSTALSNLYSTLLNASAYGTVPLPIATVSAPQPTPAEGDPAGLLSSVPGQPISSAMQAVFASALRNTLIGSSGASNALAAAAQQYQQQLQSYNWLSCILQQSNSSFVSAALEQQQQQQQQQQAQLFGPASALLNALASSYAAAAVAAQAAHGPAMPATTTCPSSNLMPMNAGAVSAAPRTISTLDSTSTELPEKIFTSSSTETLNNKHKRRRNYGHSPVTVAITHYSDVELRTSSDPVLGTSNFSRDVRKVHHNSFDFTKNDDADGGETKSIEPEQNCGTMSAKHGINDNDEEMTDDGESSQLGASTSPALASNYNSATVARGGTSSKRVRTTILPEQYDFLFQQFKLDSNPSRTRLEFIANRAGLAKRVVQVWYQNTRARERKGTLNIAHQSINKRCPVCKVRFSARSALEQHLSTKHSDDVSRGTVSVDVLTDTDSEGPNEESIASISATE